MRWRLLATGRMPNTKTWHTPWHSTPNIHPCTILDFLDLAEGDGHTVERWLAVDEQGLSSPWKRSTWLANLFGEQAVFLLNRRGGRRGRGSASR